MVEDDVDFEFLNVGPYTNLKWNPDNIRVMLMHKFASYYFRDQQTMVFSTEAKTLNLNVLNRPYCHGSYLLTLCLKHSRSFTLLNYRGIPFLSLKKP